MRERDSPAASEVLKYVDEQGVHLSYDTSSPGLPTTENRISPTRFRFSGCAKAA